jgi:3',5'-cyclic AMP phosphodiesterase CpdA
MENQKIIHLSDLHIGLSQQESIRTHMIFESVANKYAGIPVLITGDIVDCATVAEFIEARKLADKLSKTNPILMVPGNHDYKWKGNLMFDSKAWRNWIKYLGSPLGWDAPEAPWLEMGSEPVGVDGLGVWTTESCVFVGIDSGDPKNRVLCARGYVSDRLATALTRVLQEHVGKTRIVMLHHHPFSEGFFTALTGANLLLAAVRNNCELLIFGHDHNYGMWLGRDEVPLIVASHKCTTRMSGDCYMFTVIEMQNPATPNPSLRHWLEVIEV